MLLHAFLSLRPTLFLVATSFLDPVLGAMMKQICWHSGHRGEQERIEVGSKTPPVVAKSSPTAAKLGCAFSHSAEHIVDELGLLYLKTVEKKSEKA